MRIFAIDELSAAQSCLIILGEERLNGGLRSVLCPLNNTWRYVMSDSDRSFDKSCYRDCESAYQSCMSSKEHESVCKMKHAQCSCGCIID